MVEKAEALGIINEHLLQRKFNVLAFYNICYQEENNAKGDSLNCFVFCVMVGLI